MDITQLIATLLVDTTASWLRMLLALGISILVSLAIGIWAARSERVGRIVLPIVDILQTLPILAFFPFVIYVVVTYFPPFLGINAAVVFLIITSMIWNMIFGVYEAVKTLPNEFSDVSSLYRMSILQRLRKIYVPAAMPKLAEQSVLSWAIGLFYLVTSEIFSTGSSNYAVSHGIGVELTQLAFSGNYVAYGVGILVFMAFVIATRYLLFVPLEKHYTKPYRGVAEKAKLHKLHGEGMHRIRLFREIEDLYRNRLAANVRNRIRKEERLRLVPEITPILIEQQKGFNQELRMFALAAIAVLIIILVLTGVINVASLVYEEEVLINLAASFLRVWITFAIILVIAVPVCVYLIFMSKRVERYLALFQIIASIPATIVLPIIVIALRGYPDSSNLVAVSVFFLSGIWYIVFSCISNAKTLQSEISEVKKIFHVKGLSAWKNIYLKAIAPGLITGAVTAIAAEWNASIVAEYFTSTGVGAGTVLSSVGLGIGKLLDTSLASGNLQLMALALINLTIMIILINTFVWKKLYKRMSDVYK